MLDLNVNPRTESDSTDGHSALEVIPVVAVSFAINGRTSLIHNVHVYYIYACSCINSALSKIWISDGP